MKSISKPFGKLLTLTAFIVLLLSGFQAYSQTYCNPTYSPQGNSWMITQFSIPEAGYSITIPSWNQTNNTGELIMLSPGEEYTFQITTTGWIGVGVAADLNNDGDFEDEGEILAEPTYITSSPATYEYMITIPEDLEDGSYRLRLWNALANAGNGNPPGSPCGAYSYGTFADFTLAVGNCFAPLNVQIADLGQNQATVNWTAVGLAEQWNIEYGTGGFEQGEGTLITGIEDTSYELTELTADTQYDIYIQSDCDDEGLSGWSGPISFTTHFVSVPIEVIGFNEDVIANGVGPMLESTTNIVDNDSFCFLSQDWKLNEEDPDITVGLPWNGVITTTSAGPGVTYQMSPFDNPYEGNNSLRIAAIDSSGTLELAQPAAYQSLFFLVTSGSGTSSVEILVSFADGSSQIFMSQAIPDWYQTGAIPVEISGFGRGNVNTNAVETPSNNPKLFRLTVDIAPVNIDKPITTLQVTKISGNGIVNVFAVSGKSDEVTCVAPENLMLESATATTATFSWEASPSEVDGYEWLVMQEGVAPNLEDAVTSGGVAPEVISVQVDGLLAETSYDFYVAAICGTEESLWTGPLNFITDLEDCEAPSNFSIDVIGSFEIAISWTEPQNTANIEGYGWVVVLEGHTPFEDDHIVEDFASVGETSAEVMGLEPNTTYDIYFVSICDLEGMWFSNFSMETFTTETLSVADNGFSGFSFYPNPSSGYIQLQAAENLQHVKLYNIRGQELLTINEISSSSLVVDLENYSPGIYMMKVTIAGRTVTFRVIKK